MAQEHASYLKKICSLETDGLSSKVTKKREDKFHRERRYSLGVATFSSCRNTPTAARITEVLLKNVNVSIKEVTCFSVTALFS